jgi:hypothetical protein
MMTDMMAYIDIFARLGNPDVWRAAVRSLDVS